MNVAEVKKAIRSVISHHKSAFKAIGTSQPKLLELGAVAGFVQHYTANGFTVSFLHPKGKKTFAIKTSTRGYPWNFTRVQISDGAVHAELHMNLMVRSAHDAGVYCVDVGIVEAGTIPTAKPTGPGPWLCLENQHLVTFAEVKKLVIYPMLLAQFLGIVHEIKPGFLTSNCGLKLPHISPMLIALGHFSGNAGIIVANYPHRGIHITVVENFDSRLAKVRGDLTSSPFV